MESQTSPKFILQDFSAQFTEAVVALILPIQQVEFGVKITLADQPDLLAIPEIYQKGNGGFWLAFEAETQDLAGTIALLDIGNQQLMLKKMFVRQAFRGSGQGVGQLLLNRAVEHSISKNAADIFLGTTAFMAAAHRFYEKNGFQKIDPALLPESFPRMAVDTVFYWKNLG